MFQRTRTAWYPLNLRLRPVSTTFLALTLIVICMLKPALAVAEISTYLFADNISAKGTGSICSIPRINPAPSVALCWKRSDKTI
jgi:hypothetical protein